MFINIEFHLSLCFYSKCLYFCNKYRLDGLCEKIMIYKTCAKELVIPLIAAIPDVVAVIFVDVHSTD